MNIGDYIIFHDDTLDKKKNLLGKIEKLNPLLVRLQPNAYGELHSAEVPQNAILCSVGQNPKVGSVYGVDLTNVYRKSVEIEKFGRLLYFYAPEKSVRKALKHAFEIVATKLESEKLYSIFDEQVIYSVKRMKNAGLFTDCDETNSVPYHIDINPEACTIEDLPYVFLHEIGHYHFNKLDSDWQVKWVKLFSSYVRMERFTVKEMKNLRESFANSGLSFADFKKEIDESDQVYFKSVVQHLCRCFKMTAKQLEILYEEDPETVLSKFPSTCTKTDYETPVSEYATKNYSELFAESFAFYLLGYKLPEKVNTLTKKTISVLQI